MTASVCTGLQQGPMQGLMRNVRWMRGRIWALLSLDYLKKITCQNMLGGTCLDNSCVPCSIGNTQRSPHCKGLWERIADSITVFIVFHHLVVNTLDCCSPCPLKTVMPPPARLSSSRQLHQSRCLQTQPS